MDGRRCGGDNRGLKDAAAATRRDEEQHHNTMNSPEEAGADDLSLEEILRLYNQPINEEQAWAVCYQCCRTLATEHRGAAATGASSAATPRRISGPGGVRIQKDGSVRVDHQGCEGKYSPCTTTEVIESLGIMIYKALDYGLKENEERELSPPLEQLIDLMTNMAEAEREACLDEGYEATEEEDEVEDSDNVSGIRGYRDIFNLCTAHLPSVSDAPSHYQAVCRALYTETRELRTFLEKIKSAKENLRKMEESSEEPGRDLNELQNADWARFWVQVMRDLREGVKLKKVQERQYNPLPIEYQLTPYEMLMDDIRSKRYKLRKVMVNGDIPPRLKKSAHEVILEFIRSRPPLNPVSARKLKPQTQPPPTLHERILEEIKAERKLRPVSPDEVRRGRLVIRPLSMSFSFDASDEFSPRMGRRTSSSLSLTNGSGSPRVEPSGSQSVPQRKRLLKAPSLAELDSSDSEDEIVGRKSASSSSVATSLMDDTSPESVLGKKTPPMFLPISSTPQPERRKTPQRRHSIEKETPTNVRPFQPPSKQSSKSLVGIEISHHSWIPFLLHPSPSTLCPLWSSNPIEVFVLGLVKTLFALCRKVYILRRDSAEEEFCFPVECLSLTVEEVMHIRQVLVKAELEKFQQYKDIYNAMKKGKLCFCCRAKRFSFFTWSYTCQFCKKPVCAQCCKKMRLPSKPYSSLPIYSIGSTNTLPRERISAMASVGQGLSVAGAPGPSKPGGAAASPALKEPAKGASKGPRKAPGAATTAAAAKTDKSSSNPQRHSIQKTMSKFSKHGSLKSHEELELPPELTEDWATMEVCVDCKKFICDIIASSKHSLSLATKRARLKRKTQSFYMSSPKDREEYHPSERTISEI
ncbi:protein spire homolog 1-like isoform X2 [Astatotilapia calliptera]|uniref:protein spire homolog 1-like isoform X2 n=1 Tax=Astatotilapia calliptera TaxID=8154 RepID=UPI000E40DB58|nr:protein spire homolog 1-like isoform X2 [Astatotilapia calliptera]